MRLHSSTFFLFLSLSLSLSVSLSASSQSVGKQFPLFYVKAGSATWTNDSLKGKIVFMNFWFENCPPCVAEMSTLNDLYQKLKDSSNVAFLSFTSESQERVKFLKTKYNINYPVATISKSECYRLNQDNGFPTTLIVDGNGVIRFLKAGGYLDKEKVEQFFDDVFNKIVALQADTAPISTNK